MRRRRVVRFTVGYAAASFVALQLAEIVFPAFGIGEAALRLLVVVVAVGFLPSVALAWVFDVTAEGVSRTEEKQPGKKVVGRLALGTFVTMALVLASGLGWYLLDAGPLAPTAPGEPIEAYDPRQPIRALAVLPLADFSPAGDQEYLAAGMHEELIAKLSMLEDVRVVSRTTAIRYGGTTLSMPEIGRELGVDVVIEGSVNRSGDRVRITLQIIHAPTDSHIATLQFDQEADDILSLQTEVAHAVAHEIGGAHDEAVFQRVAANVDPDAQEAYLRGRHEYDRGTPEGYRTAVDYFQNAVVADPDFAPAMAGLAGARFLASLDDSAAATSDLERARTEALSALALDTTSLEVREVLALIEESLPELTDGPPGEPPSPPRVGTLPAPDGEVVVPPVGHLLLDTGWVAAITSLGRRIEDRMRARASLDSAQLALQSRAEARSLMATGRYADAARQLEGAVAASRRSDPVWHMLARSYVGAGDPRSAVDAIRRWSDSDAPDAPDDADVRRLAEAVTAEGEVGYWRWTLDRLTAQEVRGQPVPRTELAAAHAALGHADEAIELLAEALLAREPGLVTLGSDRVWDRLRGDRRFREIEREAEILRFRRPVVPVPEAR